MPTSHRTKGGAHRKNPRRKWSATVTAHSNALALEQSVFTWKDPRRIAAS